MAFLEQRRRAGLHHPRRGRRRAPAGANHQQAEAELRLLWSEWPQDAAPREQRLAAWLAAMRGRAVPGVDLRPLRATSNSPTLLLRRRRRRAPSSRPATRPSTTPIGWSSRLGPADHRDPSRGAARRSAAGAGPGSDLLRGPKGRLLPVRVPRECRSRRRRQRVADRAGDRELREEPVRQPAGERGARQSTATCRPDGRRTAHR